MKKHNFYAGPSILSQFTIKNTADAVLDFAGTGLSVLEVSHRSKEFEAVMSEARQLMLDLLDAPAGYTVLYLGGGASLQFCQVPYNMLNKKATYLDTGVWAAGAIKEAKFFGEVEIAASSKESTYSYIPKDWTISDDSEYFHYTSNNTIYGTQIRKDPDLKIPLICDMSSDILSRPIDVSKYDVIYGGAQKNLAPAGATFVIIKESALGRVERKIPTMLDYRQHISKDSMMNTPPVLPVYSALQTLKYYKSLGGVEAIAKINEEKAMMLYSEIERNSLFKGTVAEEDRSYMNICFIMNEEYKELEKEFGSFAKERGLIGLEGHRSVGGFRASTYNALPKESVQALIDAMQEFERKI